MTISYNQFSHLVQAILGTRPEDTLNTKPLHTNLIYRGESTEYDMVSSKILRGDATIKVQDAKDKEQNPTNPNDTHITITNIPDPQATIENILTRLVQEIQSYIIAEAKKHIHSTTHTGIIPENLETPPNPREDQEILFKLQHYGGNTNLIDFTYDPLIALYFACRKPSEKGDGTGGRIIILDTNNPTIQEQLIHPTIPENRIIAQKSIFIQPPPGFIRKERFYKVCPVPEDKKEDIIQGLEIYHKITAQTLYNDIHGFVQYYQEQPKPSLTQQALQSTS